MAKSKPYEKLFIPYSEGLVGDWLLYDVAVGAVDGRAVALGAISVSILLPCCDDCCCEYYCCESLKGECLCGCFELC